MIRFATPEDVPTVARLIRALADYERLGHTVTLNESRLREHLFGKRPFAEVLLAEEGGKVIGFALFFYNFSTFRGQPGIYLEDLFVDPVQRGKGHGKALLFALAQVAVERGLRAVGVVGPQLERAVDSVLQKTRCRADGRVDGLSVDG